ncbi:uncharacterized protein LOC5519590 [Nematostella vectensis]|uniref:uncharacterized protein LOC5519590 n=1 Tax=Nematostella vectensis TaxID=45351 RepID=UPI0013905D14|nr:uncharacterized protein LOC5519590 [Nematostella vectensis]
MASLAHLTIAGIALSILLTGGQETHAYFKIPPKRVTAYELAHYFLNPMPNDLQPGRHDKRDAGDEFPFTYNVVYVLDSSTSITKVDFENGIKAIQLLTAKARNDTKFALILYAAEPVMVTNFTTQASMLQLLTNVQRLYGKTNTFSALELCRKLFFVKSGSLNRVLLVTDGLSNMNQDKMLYEAFQLKMSNIEIFVVAVGRYNYGADEISSLSSIPTTHIYRVESMRGLVRIIMWIPTGERG